MLEVINVSKSFGEKKVIHNLDFTVKQGEILALLGENGAGKTTTFRMILGILEPTEGKVLFKGEKIGFDIAPKIGFLPEERSLLKKMTVREQVRFFGELKKMDIKEIDRKLDYYLEYFNIPEADKMLTKQLSKGNQQKIQFITAILNDPELLILDEPFSGLDPLNIRLFRNLILELKDKGSAIIFSSHRLDYVELFSKDIIFLNKGIAEMNGKIDDIKKESDSFNVEIHGKIDKEIIKAQDYVLELNDSIKDSEDEYVVKVSGYENVSKLFNLVKDSEGITKFNVELPTLEEIILEKVGEYNE